MIAGAQAQGVAELNVDLDSRFVVVGERTRLTLEVKNVPIVDWPDSPRMSAPLSLKREGKTNITRNGRIQEVFEYSVTALKEGVHVIPPFEIPTNSGVIRSKSAVVRVFPVSDLATKGIKIGATVTPYLSGIFLEKESPYLGETQDAEAKVYVSQAAPHMLRLSDGQVINMEKDGIAAWRFTTNRRNSGILEFDGHTFAVYTYRSSINALREGGLSLGPGEAEPIFQRRVAMRGGFASVRHLAKIEFPARKINVRPLPKGAPPEFEGAVGNFSLDVKALSRELKAGDTITIEAMIHGTGNIDQFPGPVPVDPDGDWKIFEMTAKPPGSERRTSSGTVEFSQIIRPLKEVPAIPPYRFVFFDPVLEKYQTLETAAQPIVFTGGTFDLSAAAEDGLKFLTPSGVAPRSFSSGNRLPGWIWQIIPAAVLLGILTIIFKSRAKARLVSQAPTREFEEDLQRVRAKEGDRVSFYREASRVATEWTNSNVDQKGFEELFQTRDEICFLPEKAPEPVAPDEKNRILNLLKSLSPILLVMLFFTFQISPLQALDQNPEKAKSEILAAMESEPAVEHFYNLALCEKALDNPGQAALWAYRFQAQGGEADEIFKGLPGIKGRTPEGTEWVSILPKSLYFQIGLGGCWALVILLVALKLPPGKLKDRLIGICGFCAILGMSVGFTSWYLYPDEISFEPIHTLSVVTQPAPLRSQAFEGGNEMREDLAGSLCKVTAERAGFYHIILPGGLSGWISSDSVTDIAE